MHQDRASLLQVLRSKKIDLVGQDVHIWPITLNQIKLGGEAPYLAVLSSEENKRAQSFIFEKDQRRFALGRGLLRYLLGIYLNRAPESLTIHYAKRGKPLIAGQPSVQFNLSHTGDYLVYAFTRYFAIGVDVEQVKFRDNLLEIAQRFFSPDEYMGLKALPPEHQMQRFYQLWVCKEAMIKALGEGLWASLSDYDIDFTPGQIRLNKIEGSQTPACDWHLSLLDLWPDCQSAVAVEGRAGTIINCMF